MAANSFRSAILLPIAVFFLFGSTLPYNGVGHSLPWLSLSGAILLVWLSISIVRSDLAHFRVTWGWLPAVALAYVGWLFINPTVSTYAFVSSVTAVQLGLLPLSLLGWLVWQDENKDRTWRAIWTLLSLGGFALAVWGGFDFLVLSTLAHGPLIDANAYGALINLILIPTAFAYLRAPSSLGHGIRNLRLHLCAIALLSLALFMSLSRGGLMSLLAVLPLIFWFNRGSPAFRQRAGLLLVVLAAAYVTVKFMPIGSSKTIETLLLAPGEQTESDGSIQARLLMWKATWEIVEQNNILIGTGLGTYKNYYATYRDPRETMSSGNLAHNDYLQALQEGGLIQLGFLLVLAIVTPVLLLRMRRHSQTASSSDTTDDSRGLLLGVLAISIHAVVNFIHYVAPIAVLTGLYLGRSWETIKPQRQLRLLPLGREHIKPGYLKGLAIVLLAVPVSTLAIDGIIFRLFDTKDPWIAHFTPSQRFAIVNAALAIRAGNPKPRVFLIQDLLEKGSKTNILEDRERFIGKAENEAKALMRTAPALASGRYFLGMIRVLRGAPEELRLARDDFEHAVKLVPESTVIRLSQILLYQRLGMEQEALQSIREAKKWFTHESDYRSLAAFAKEASLIAARQGDHDEAEFWQWVCGRLAGVGIPG